MTEPADEMNAHMEQSTGLADVVEEKRTVLRQLRNAREGIGVWSARLYPLRMAALVGGVIVVVNGAMWLAFGGPSWRDVSNLGATLGAILAASAAGVWWVARVNASAAQRALDLYAAASADERAAWEALFERFGLRDPDDTRAVLRLLAMRGDVSWSRRAAALWAMAERHQPALRWRDNEPGEGE